VLIAPRPGGDLTWADTSLDTPHGVVKVKWHTESGVLTVETELPAGVTGVLSLDNRPDVELGEGSHVHTVESR
jgi:alpha-L-rhamnosidase